MAIIREYSSEIGILHSRSEGFGLSRFGRGFYPIDEGAGAWHRNPHPPVGERLEFILAVCGFTVRQFPTKTLVTNLFRFWVVVIVPGAKHFLTHKGSLDNLYGRHRLGGQVFEWAYCCASRGNVPANRHQKRAASASPWEIHLHW